MLGVRGNTSRSVTAGNFTPDPRVKVVPPAPTKRAGIPAGFVCPDYQHGVRFFCADRRVR